MGLSDRISNIERQPVEREDELLSTIAPAAEPQPQKAEVRSLSTIEKKVQALIDELNAMPEISAKGIHVYLEKELGKTILSTCDEDDFTPATFIEAAYIILSQHPSMFAKVKTEAKRRKVQRYRAGQLKKRLTEIGLPQN